MIPDLEWAFPCRIPIVKDGDTFGDVTLDVGFGIRFEEDFRLLGLDTPESSRPDSTLELEAGLAVSAAVSRLIANGSGEWPFVVRSQLERRDGTLDAGYKGAYRWMGEFWRKSDGLNLNQWLLDENLARPMTRYDSRRSLGAWKEEDLLLIIDHAPDLEPLI